MTDAFSKPRKEAQISANIIKIQSVFKAHGIMYSLGAVKDRILELDVLITYFNMVIKDDGIQIEYYKEQLLNIEAKKKYYQHLKDGSMYGRVTLGSWTAL
jgi:hypothetical protein